MNIPQEVKDSIEELNWMRERWENTPVWHEDENSGEPFVNGAIDANTGDLMNMKVLLDFVDTLEKNYECAYWKELVKNTVIRLGNITGLGEYERGIEPCLKILEKEFDEE